MDGYAVIEFSTSDPTEIAVIPSIWFKNSSKDTCLWPSFGSQKEMDEAIMQRLEPKEEWTEHSVRCLYETDTYENAWEKLIESTSGVVAENHNDLENSRKRKWDQFIGSDSEEDSANDRDPISYGDTPMSFESQVLSLLETIREQNSEIIRLLKIQMNDYWSPPLDRPQLPVELPMKTESDVNTLENYLSQSDKNCIPLIRYLSGLGGTNLQRCTHRIMKVLMTDNLASMYSYMGVRQGKGAFSTLKLNSVVIKSVKQRYKSASDSDVEEILKKWLKYGKERVLAKQKRLNKSQAT